MKPQKVVWLVPVATAVAKWSLHFSGTFLLTALRLEEQICTELRDFVDFLLYILREQGWGLAHLDRCV